MPPLSLQPAVALQSVVGGSQVARQQSVPRALQSCCGPPRLPHQPLLLQQQQQQQQPPRLQLLCPCQ